MSIEVSELVELMGVVPKKAEQTVRNQAHSAALRFLLDEAKKLGEIDPETTGKRLFLMGTSLKPNVTDDTRTLLVSYLFKPEDQAIATHEQVTAAIAFCNESSEQPPAVADLEKAGGVNQIPSAEAIAKAVAGTIEELKEQLVEYKVIKGVREQLPFAPGSAITDEVKKQLSGVEGVIDEKTLKKQKQAELKAKRKEEQQKKKEAERLEREKQEQEAAEAAASAAAAAAAAAASSEADKPAAASGESHQLVTPWEVEAEGGVDYNRLIEDFGCVKISDEDLERFKKFIKPGMSVHRFLRRNIFFSHRDLGVILDALEAGKPLYLYTGRGPSSGAMHLGHLIPFMFTKYLQEALDVKLVVQMTDDEKFLFKEKLTLDSDPETGVEHLLRENVKDIIACGFDPEKTFIFSDLEYMGGAFYKNIVRVQRCISLNKACSVFGFTESHNIGQIAFAAVQASPSFPSSFPGFIDPDASCLIPCAIDQDPYFRLTRDVAPRLGYKKPALIHSKFFPAMTGSNSKMSSSVATEKTVFLTDTKKQIKKKINNYAFSGASSSLEEHREKGANTDVDVPYQYLRFFLEDDDELERIRVEYSSGRMTTGEVKGKLIDVLSELVQKHQDARAKVTDEDIARFMSYQAQSSGGKAHTTSV